MEDSYKLPLYDQVGFCSDKCLGLFWLNVQSYPVEESIGTDSIRSDTFPKEMLNLWNKAILHVASRCSLSSHLVPQFKHAISLKSRSNIAFPFITRDELNNVALTKEFRDFRKKTILALAHNLEECGRLKDAAEAYEFVKIYDKARTLREKERNIVVKKTSVSVDLNALLAQVKDGGIVALFLCPNCGGNLKINGKTTTNSLRICEYCNSEIDSVDLADFLEALLG